MQISNSDTPDDWTLDCSWVFKSRIQIETECPTERRQLLPRAIKRPRLQTIKYLGYCTRMPLRIVSPLTTAFPILRSVRVAPATFASFPLSPTTCPPWKEGVLTRTFPNRRSQVPLVYHLDGNCLATINLVALSSVPSRHPSFLHP
jgi:hypothetical protein